MGLKEWCGLRGVCWKVEEGYGERFVRDEVCGEVRYLRGWEGVSFTFLNRLGIFNGLRGLE